MDQRRDEAKIVRAMRKIGQVNSECQTKSSGRLNWIWITAPASTSKDKFLRGKSFRLPSGENIFARWIGARPGGRGRDGRTSVSSGRRYGPGRWRGPARAR